MRLINIPPRFLLPLLMFVGLLAGGFRAGDAWQSIITGALFSPIQTVHAKEHVQQKDTHSTKSDAPAAQPKKEEKPETKLYKQLSGRREQLDKRTKKLNGRETVIIIAEKRIDQKMKEMQTLKKQLKSLLGQASSSQAAQISNLVKIYETMKPKEAARIFETLEMKVLLQVVQRMKPARTAAVMAKMAPLKAKAITVALTRRDQLPQEK